jgi:hypothetical protein
MTSLPQRLPDEPLLATLRAPRSMADLSLRDWDGLLRLARSANLVGRLGQHALELGLIEQLPAAVRPHLVAAARLNAHQQQAIIWESRHLAAALQPLGVPVLLLKGAGYVLSGRRAARGRLFGDVDLMVPRAAITAAEAALMVHGWSMGKVDPYDQRYYRQWMHELPPMAHMQRGTVVDLHHNILPLTARRVPDAQALLAASVPVPGTPFSVLAPEDMVIHSAVHLFHEGQLKNGLRDLFDLDSLLLEFGGDDAGFWPRLNARAAALGLAGPVLLALRLVAALIGTPVPAAALDAARQAAGIGGLRLATLDALYLRALRPDHPLADLHGTAAARALLYLRAHALRMPPHQLALHLGRKAMLRLVKNSSRNIG